MLTGVSAEFEKLVGSQVIDEISKEYEGKSVVCKLDVDLSQDYAAKYGVRNIPTVLLFDKNEMVGCSLQKGIC